MPLRESTVQSGPPASPRIVVSTDTMPERDRLPFFRDELTKVLNVDINPLSEGVPRYAMDHVAAGPIGFNLLEGTPARYLRSRRHLGDADENFTLGIFRSGWENFSQNGKSVHIDTGEAFFMANAMPEDATIPVYATVTVLSIDGAALRALVRAPERSAGDRLTAARPGFSLLKGYLQAFAATSDRLTPALFDTFGRHVLDLVASVIGATGETAAMAEVGGIRSARLHAILGAIAARATDPEFGVETMAAELAVTPRYIQRVLEETGTTFSDHLIEQRLGRARRLLTDRKSQHLKVATIAFDCGYSDLSTFNRAFRRRFGETPTAVRGAAFATGVPGSEGSLSPLAASLTKH
jgi:AraC-like DNA-binding protein